MQIGVEYNPVASEVSPLATVFLRTETDTAPAVFLGTSSDRIGSPEGTQAYYMTASKLLTVVPVSFYASVNYSEWDEGVNFPFGGSLHFGNHISVRGMYDGNQPHLMLNAFADRYGVSLIWVWLESFGISLVGGL